MRAPAGGNGWAGWGGRVGELALEAGRACGGVLRRAGGRGLAIGARAMGFVRRRRVGSCVAALRVAQGCCRLRSDVAGLRRAEGRAQPQASGAARFARRASLARTRGGPLLSRIARMAARRISEGGAGAAVPRRRYVTVPVSSMSRAWPFHTRMRAARALAAAPAAPAALAPPAAPRSARARALAPSRWARAESRAGASLSMPLAPRRLLVPPCGSRPPRAAAAAIVASRASATSAGTTSRPATRLGRCMAARTSARISLSSPKQLPTLRQKIGNGGGEARRCGAGEEGHYKAGTGGRAGGTEGTAACRRRQRRERAS